MFIMIIVAFFNQLCCFFCAVTKYLLISGVIAARSFPNKILFFKEYFNNIFLPLHVDNVTWSESLFHFLCVFNLLTQKR